MLSCSYTSANFKLTKYQHLELILRENKLTYTKLISDATHFETTIGIELNKPKKINFHKKAGDTIQSCVCCTSITLRDYPFGIICSTSHYSSSLPIREYLLPM